MSTVVVGVSTSPSALFANRFQANNDPYPIKWLSAVLVADVGEVPLVVEAAAVVVVVEEVRIQFELHEWTIHGASSHNYAQLK